MGRMFLWQALDGALHEDNEADATGLLNQSVDLYSGVFRVMDNWVPEVADEDATSVEETIPLMCPRGTPASVILAELVEIDRMASVARQYRLDFTQERAMFLCYETDVGPTMKSWVSSMKYQLKAEIGSNGFLEHDSAALDLIIVRHPAWETLEPVTEANISNQSQAFNTGSSTYTWSKSIPGTMNARMRRMEISSSAAITNNIEKIWIGFKRDTGHGIDWGPFGTNFAVAINIGEFDTDSVVAISLGSSTEGGDALRTTFDTDATMIKRAYIGMWGESFGAGSADEVRGKYVLLMSARTAGAAATCYVQTRHGYEGMDDVDYIANNIVKVTDTDYHIFNMGTFRTPLFPSVGASGMVDQHALDQRMHVYAERVSGTGRLEIDGFVSMPLDAYIAGDKLRANFTGQNADIRTRPDDQIVAFSFSGNLIDLATSLAPQNWGIPWGPAPRMCILIEGDVDFLFSRDVEIDNIEYFPRTRQLHG